MKLFQLFKPKAQAISVTDWIDHDTVKALEDETAAALKINEPLLRLIALKTAQGNIAKALLQTNAQTLLPPLTATGKAQMADIKVRAAELEFWSPYAITLSVLGIAFIPLSLGVALGLPALLFAVPGAFVAFPVGQALASKHLAAIEKPLRDLGYATGPLPQLLQTTRQAVIDIETTLSLDEARASEHLDAALDVSPALEARFNKEAGRAAIRGPANPPQESRIIPKPIRRDIAV